jgi:hypothetical protein
MTLQQIQGLRRSISLTGIVMEYRPKAFIADRVLPTIPVETEQGIYYKWDNGNFSIPETLRAPRSVYKEIDFSATEETFKAREDGLEARIDDRERRQARGILDPDAGLARRLTNAILLSRERRIANLVTSTTNITQNTTLVGAAQWSDPTSDPAADAATARAAIRAATGFLPNTLTIGQAVKEGLRLHPAIIDFVDGGRPTDQDLADFFEVAEVIVAQTIYNTAREGATASLADIWGKDALFYYRNADNATIDDPSFGYQFVTQDTTAFRYRDVTVNCDVVRVTEIRAAKLTAPELGYLVKNAVA